MVPRLARCPVQFLHSRIIPTFSPSSFPSEEISRAPANLHETGSTIGRCPPRRGIESISVIAAPGNQANSITFVIKRLEPGLRTRARTHSHRGRIPLGPPVCESRFLGFLARFHDEAEYPGKP